MGKTDEAFRSALSEKKIPILTLDNKWHQLFTQQECTDEIRDMECELNGLLKRQGKVNEKKREIRKLKKKLMDEIVLLADEMEGGATISSRNATRRCWSCPGRSSSSITG